MSWQDAKPPINEARLRLHGRNVPSPGESGAGRGCIFIYSPHSRTLDGETQGYPIEHKIVDCLTGKYNDDRISDEKEFLP